MRQKITEIEKALSEYPIFEYRFVKTSQIDISEKIRKICEMNDCKRYGESWACPPAVGTIEECAGRMRAYEDCFVFSTVAEVSDPYFLDGSLAARNDHEDLTCALYQLFKEWFGDALALSTGCMLCETCTYPDAPCRHPDKAFASAESHGVVIAKLTERFGMESHFDAGAVTYFSMIFFNGIKS